MRAFQTPTERDRYHAYVAWCQQIGIEPADFGLWRREISKIYEVQQPNQMRQVVIRPFGAQ